MAQLKHQSSRTMQTESEYTSQNYLNNNYINENSEYSAKRIENPIKVNKLKVKTIERPEISIQELSADFKSNFGA